MNALVQPSRALRPTLLPLSTKDLIGDGARIVWRATETGVLSIRVKSALQTGDVALLRDGQDSDLSPRLGTDDPPIKREERFEFSVIDIDALERPSRIANRREHTDIVDFEYEDGLAAHPRVMRVLFLLGEPIRRPGETATLGAPGAAT